jgi:MFS transporter, BCD family, chlorophyll transporter
MSTLNDRLAAKWAEIGPGLLPFADAATDELPLGRLLRLSLFQFSVAMALVLLNGTLNRVMIVELGVPTWLVALLVSLPLLFAPLRALIGFKSDHYQSHLGWRRVPFLWFGSLLQFGGLAIMPFALILLSGDTTGPAWIGYAGSALAFLLVGVGMHTAQTAGLALATDLAPEHARPRVVAFLYVMLLAGIVVSSLVFGWLLANFSQIRLIQVIQGAALLTMVLNMVALWKQELRVPNRNIGVVAPNFADALNALRAGDRWTRVLVAVALGTAAFSMQDILLEPYGGEVLKLTVGATTVLTGLLAFGTLVGLVLAATQLSSGIDPFRLAGLGVVSGLVAFPFVIFSAAAESAWLFRAGVALIGFGGGLFSVGTLTAAMNMARDGQSGLALGAWGAVQASAAGLAILLGGGLRDLFATLAANGSLGSAITGPAVGYNAVYYIEIILLFATLAALGPLVRPTTENRRYVSAKFGLAEFPG